MFSAKLLKYKRPSMGDISFEMDRRYLIISHLWI